MKTGSESLWHVTVLSNFARAYDKYGRRYSKAAISESTFPDRFFLLRKEELAAGIKKASGLLRRLGIDGDRLLALRSQVPETDLQENTRTGIGRYVNRPWITIDGLEWQTVDIGKENSAGVSAGSDLENLEPVTVEEAMARSLQLLNPNLASFNELHPRSLSVLPIARGCQASCPFCFSEASASAEQDQARLDLEKVRALAGVARKRGAERFVITGGGEPGLVRHPLLCKLIEAGAQVLGKTVLITNGHHLAKRSPADRAEALRDYAQAGLGVLSISRHHHDQATSRNLMSLETDVGAIARTWKSGLADWPGLRMRLVCVLQRGGIDRHSEMEAYVSWAASIGVSEICFKELYVSTSIESEYHRHSANAWSHDHQIPLSMVLDFGDRHGLEEVGQLPWRAPILAGEWQGKRMQIAAYTEPSLLWERSQRIARSWNLMADGRCLVSLEDRNSEIDVSVQKKLVAAGS